MQDEEENDAALAKHEKAQLLMELDAREIEKQRTIDEYYQKKAAKHIAQRKAAAAAQLNPGTKDVVDVEDWGDDTQAQPELQDFPVSRYGDYSLLLFSPTSPYRRFCNKVVTSHLFNRLILLHILANCVMLAVLDPTGLKEQPRLREADLYFISVFTLELIMRVSAKGLIFNPRNPKVLATYGIAYLRDPWNWVDFLVVLTAWPPLFIDAPAMSAFRSFRVLRPLRLLNVVPSMRRIVSSLLLSMSFLTDIAIQMVFLLSLFSILGMMLFMGDFHKYCTQGTVEYTDENNPDRISCGWVQCAQEVPDADPPLFCSDRNNETGEIFEAPEFGFVQFDNYPYSMLTTFTCATLEGWTDVTYTAMDTTNPAASLYFIALVLIMGFVVLNLAVAVIAQSFQNTERTGGVPGGGSGSDEDESRHGKVMIWLRTLSANIAERAQFWLPVQTVIRRIVLSETFDAAINVCVVLNLTFLAADHYPSNPALDGALDTCNVIFSCIFFAEMCLKILALGPFDYFADRLNLCDSVVTVLSMVEVFLGGSSLGAFRFIRLFRIIKLIRNLSSLRELMYKVAASFVAVLQLIPVLFLFMFILTIVGAQVFGQSYVTLDSTTEYPDAGAICHGGAKSATGCPRENFSTFWNSFLVVFLVMTGENWNAVMYQAMAYTKPAASLYFVITHIITNLILLNILLTVMLLRFIAPDEATELAPEKPRGFISNLRMRLGNWSRMFVRWLSGIKERLKRGRDSSHTREEGRRRGFRRRRSQRSSQGQTAEDGLALNFIYEQLDDSFYTANAHFSDEDGEDERSYRTFRSAIPKGSELSEDVGCRERSLFLFGPENPFRKVCLRIVDHKIFNALVLTAILGSCLTMTLYTPQWPSGSPVPFALAIADVVWQSAFTIEAFIKIVALGFVRRPGSYLRNAWNRLDLVIVIAGWIEFIPGDQNFIKPFRVLRVLRPIRMVKRLDGLQIVFTAIFRAAPVCANVIVVAALIWFMFAVVGVNQFAGTFYSCQCDFVPYGTDTPVIGEDQTFRVSVFPNQTPAHPHPRAVRQSFGSSCTTEFIEFLQQQDNARVVCEENGGTWVTNPSNFDNVLNALLALFEVATLENWLDIMYAAMDSVGIDKEPIEDHREWSSVYFLVFIFIGSFFVLNLFVSVIVDAFGTFKRESEYGGCVTMTRAQYEWLEGQRMAMRMSVVQHLVPPQHDVWLSHVRLFCFKVATSQVFNWVVTVVIVVNTISMAVEFWPADKRLVLYLVSTNIAFQTFFTIEVIVKLMGLGTKQYFGDKWNTFDFVVWALAGFPTVAGIIAIVFPVEIVDLEFFALLRLLRILRIVRLAGRVRTLRVLFETLYLALPSIFNVGALFMLILFMYGVLGVELFGQVGVLEYPPPNGGGISKYANFWNFGMAVFTLIRAATGEAWNSIMWDLIVQGGPLTYSWIYFVSYVVLGSFVLLNLFIAVVLEAFATVLERQSFLVGDADLNGYSRAWSRFDPAGDGYIDVGRDLKPLLRELSRPLGVGRRAGLSTVLHFIDQLRTPNGSPLVGRGTRLVGFHDLLMSLVSRVYRVDVRTLPEGLRNRFTADTGRELVTTHSVAEAAAREGDNLDSKVSSSRFYIASTTLQLIARQYLEYVNGMQRSRALRNTETLGLHERRTKSRDSDEW